MGRRKSEHASVVYKGAGGAGPTVSRVVVIITCIAAIAAMMPGFQQRASAPAESVPEAAATPASSSTASTAVLSSSTPLTPDSTATEVPSPTSSVPHIGVVAGHWGHDDGASCPDGLTEVEVNLEVAQSVVRSLRALGYHVDLLQEYDSRLQGYLADALVSIHADSCQQFPGASPPPTGFKVASVVDSLVPDEEQRLVTCITERYAERTGLGFHANSITGHMTQYHTFYEIDGRTPGAIIETGFMWLDRDLLTQQPDLVAQGIVDGVICFIEHED
jgi:N-acetylmuramoyl-L-alanine amidase